MPKKSSEYIHPSGGLLSRQFIQKLRQKNIKEKYVRADTFTMPGERSPTPSELEKKITEAWKTLLEKWFAVALPIKKYDVSTARRKWIIPLLEALDYNPHYLKKDTVVSEEKKVKIPLSHRGGDWDHAPIIHTVAPDQELDEKIAKGRGVKSPHDSLQLYLNERKKDLWGMVTNGIVLRILRDYYHTYTKGYVEFDLEAIFEERSFSDFLALYRLVHPSRFIPDEEGIPPLEHFYKTSLAAGEKIGDELREKSIPLLEKTIATYESVRGIFDDTRKSYLINALNYFCHALDGISNEEKLIDLMIAMESLFSRERQELRLRISLRSAFLLSVGKEDERSSIFKTVYGLYNKRSKIVHGVERVDLSHEEIMILVSYVRESIRCLTHIELEKDRLLGLLDQAVYDEGKKRELEEFVSDALSLWET